MFRFAHGRNLKPIIYMTSGFLSVSLSPKTRRHQDASNNPREISNHLTNIVLGNLRFGNVELLKCVSHTSRLNFYGMLKPRSLGTLNLWNFEPSKLWKIKILQLWNFEIKKLFYFKVKEAPAPLNIYRLPPLQPTTLLGEPREFGGHEWSGHLLAN